MESAEIRKKFLEFFKARGHAIVPSASLVPENDPTTLFTGSGMQPLVPYLLGERHPEGKRVANSQKSFRAEDINGIGDNRHTTFFEMLGNWSFGDYFKEEQLPWLFEFLVKEIGLAPQKLYVTVFAGDSAIGIPPDDESVRIWEKLFIKAGVDAKYVVIDSEANGSEKGMSGGRIFSYDTAENWWSRAGIPSKMPVGEPGGPDSEVFYDFGTPHDPKFGKHCHPNCDCGRFLEIGNSVFMEYKKTGEGLFEKLNQRNVDFGGGLERITAAANNDPDIFHIDVFHEALLILQDEFKKEYGERQSAFRIILDHYRAAVFILGDGVIPSNKERGYVLRRLIRRAAYAFYKNGIIDTAPQIRVAGSFIEQYRNEYPNLKERSKDILNLLEKEIKQFYVTLGVGLKILHKSIRSSSARAALPVGFEIDESERGSPSAKLQLPGDIAFDLFSTYGLPLDAIKEKVAEFNAVVDEEGFWKEFKKHQELSRNASAGTFKGGLADVSERTTRLHTAHHLLLKVLQLVLGPQVKQRGSNITSERLRIDFSYDGKMTEAQRKEVERIVNEKIAEDLPIIRSEMPREEAEKLGAEHEFGQKYPAHVSVYSVGPKTATQDDPQFGKAFSIEFCGGPHVTHTGEIGHFRIAKEEAVGAGIRRIRGVVD